MSIVYNVGLRAKLERPPRAKGGTFYYYPSILTASSKIEKSAGVTIVELPKNKEDLTVIVEHNGLKVRVMWKDLRY